ncbi:MAG: hypothetical protein U0937_02145, partial [Thermodesulfovibrionia bacterium]|nr:hypothetical protein [Thermodesulfovibrionia bacterium]
MKYKINLLFLLLLLVPSVSFAVVCGSVFVLNISYTDTCGEPSTCGAYSGSPPNCTTTLSSVDSTRCLCVYQQCCDDTALSYEDGVSYSYSQQPVSSTVNVSTYAQDVYDTTAGS